MSSFIDDPMVIQDREDLIAVLRMRFGEAPGEIIQQIYEINEMDQLQRLILAAANASSWEVFLEEFQQPEDSFRIVGEQFDPIRNFQARTSDKKGLK